MFLPLLVVVTFVILGILAFTIENSNRNKEMQEKLGTDAENLFTIYDEALRFELYMQQAQPYAEEYTVRKLHEFGGYSTQADCELRFKSIAIDETYYLLNTCPEFNPQQAYTEQMQVRLQKYVDNYHSVYPDPLQTCRGLSKWQVGEYRPVAEQLNELYNNAKVSATHQEANITVDLHPKECGYILNTDTTYTHHFSLELGQPDLNKFTQTFNLAKECTTLQACQVSFTEQGAEATIIDDIVFINHNGVKLALEEGELPNKAPSTLFQ